MKIVKNNIMSAGLLLLVNIIYVFLDIVFFMLGDRLNRLTVISVCIMMTAIVFAIYFLCGRYLLLNVNRKIFSFLSTLLFLIISFVVDYTIGTTYHSNNYQISSSLFYLHATLVPFSTLIESLTKSSLQFYNIIFYFLTYLSLSFGVILNKGK